MPFLFPVANHAGVVLSQGSSGQVDGEPQRRGALFLFAVLFLSGLSALPLFLPLTPQTWMALGSGLLLLAATVIALCRSNPQVWFSGDGAVEQVIRDDPSAAFVTDRLGRVVLSNGVARQLAGGDMQRIAAALRSEVSSPGAIFLRLQERARTQTHAREVVAGASGSIVVSVHRLGRGRYLWRIDGLSDGPTGARGADSLSVPMLTANGQGTVLFANAALRRMLGFRPRRLDEVFADGAVPDAGVTAAVPASSARAEVQTMCFESPGGRKEIYLLPVRDQTATVQTITDFDDLPVPLMRFAPDGRLTGTNRAARDLMGPSAVDQPRVQDLFDGLGRPVGDWLADVANGRHPGGAEVLQLFPAGSEAFVQVTLRPIAAGADKGGSDVLAILQDATALKRLEAQYVQSQKMQAIGQLAGGVAHDFNNLLTAISGHCDLMLLRKRAGDPDHADLTQISQNANRAAALVSQLLAFSRKQTMKPERIDLAEALADLTHLLNRLVGEKIDLRLSHDPALGPVRADRRQIEQAIMNLVVNARDAMPDGGLIRIETQVMALDGDQTRDRVSVPAGRYSVIRVRDEGVGIPTDRLEKIFEPFYTTKRPGEGTGLGLAMVYGIVKQSGGFVFVASTPGEGSCFEIWLPEHTGAEIAAPVQGPLARATPRLTEGVILLVEDEPPVRAFAARALRLRGHSVLEAESAEDALRLLSDPSIHVDVFVTDVVMPGLDGPSWVTEALKSRPQVRVVFVSGYAEDFLASLGDDLPGSVFLPKPFSLADLTQTVQRQLEAEPRPVPA